MLEEQSSCLFDRIKNEKLLEELSLEKDFDRPWGGYITFARNTACTPKILIVETELSVQSHAKRDEIWYLISGQVAVYRGQINATAELTIANLTEQLIKPGDLIYIPRLQVHTAKNLSSQPAIIAEVALGAAQEQEEQRYYDMNGRANLAGYPEGLSITELIKLCQNKISTQS